MQFLLVDPGAAAIRQLQFEIDADAIFDSISRVIGTARLETRNLRNRNTILFFEDQQYCLGQLCCLIKGGLNRFIFGKVVVINMDEKAKDEITQAFLVDNIQQIIEFFPPKLCYALKIELRAGLQHEHTPN